MTSPPPGELRGQRGTSRSRVTAAAEVHFDSFLALAAEVEHWFGAMVEEPGFHRAVRKNIARGSALVAISDNDVVGGLLFSHENAPQFDIGWLVVSEAERSRGVGEALLARAFRQWVTPPAIVTVVTFGADHPAARSRNFYERLGFRAGEAVQNGPEGGSRQQFQLHLDAELPDWA